jgi:hypothetical protein
MSARLSPILVLLSLVAASVASGQDSRDVTRERLRRLLDEAGARSDVNVTFRQSAQQPYNLFGTMRGGMANADGLEVVISVTDDETIGVRVFPHYKNDYINLDKVRDGPGLMRAMLHFNHRNFLYWGADDVGDIFCGYTFTLESGFPDDAILVVLRSIRATDGFVGDLRPFIDGSVGERSP